VDRRQVDLGNRNFEGRVHPLCGQLPRFAYAGGGNALGRFGPMSISPKEPVGLWTRRTSRSISKTSGPAPWKSAATIRKAVKASSFKSRYGGRLQRRRQLEEGQAGQGPEPINGTFGSTYVKNPPYFEGMKLEPSPVKDIRSARRCWPLLGFPSHRPTSRPPGNIKATSPAGVYLQETPG